MKFIPTSLADVMVIKPDIYKYNRGFFLESYNQKRYAEGGIAVSFVQDNHSLSKRGILRGLHAQRTQPQGKLIRVLSGEIYDVIVDIQKGSPTFKKWFGITLSAENFKQCYVPPGYAHGFCVMSESAEVEYKVTDFYDPQDELHLAWNDPDIAVQWPIPHPTLSAKDQAGLTLKALDSQLPVYTH